MQPKAATDCSNLKTLIREIPDFPIPGILFYDITTLLKDKKGFATLIDARGTRPLAQLAPQLVQLLARARGQHFHRAVVVVPHPASHAEGARLALHEPAKAHALHAPPHHEAAGVKWRIVVAQGHDTIE